MNNEPIEKLEESNLQYMEKILSYELLIHKGSPFELQDMAIEGIPCKVFPRGPQTLRDVFLKAVSFAERDFIVKDDMRLSFGQAFRCGKYFARLLRQKNNIKKGSRTALIAETGPEWAIAFMALCFAGAVPVIIPADAEKQVIEKAIELTNCELIISDLHSAHKIDAALMKRRLVIPVMRLGDTLSYIGASSGFSIVNLGDAPNCKQAALDDDDVCETMPEDEALISFTSGTTGEPKGVIHSHRNMTTGLMNMMLGGMIMSFRAAKDGAKRATSAQAASLLISPFSHIGGYSQLMLMSYLGGKIVLLPEWEPQRAAVLIEYESIRSLSGLSPAMALDLLRANLSTGQLRSLTNLNIHGLAPRKKFIREIKESFPQINLTISYGMTETCGAVSVVSGMELLDKPQLAGRILPSTQVKIVEQNGREAAIGSQGEIFIRGAMVMRAYCSGKSDYSSGILENGWLKTGDRGYVDSAGNLYITGRMDELQLGIKRLSSGELEQLICELDTIDEATVMEVKNFGRQSGIFVTVIPNNQIPVDEQELAQEVSACINAYADNINVAIMNDLPRAASGKVNRRALQSAAVQRL